ncbi:MAG TPA: NAD-dependent epimerase/dehydratase family protein [Caldilineaceae bacterium]|nr:NAD-dependent epimerase/dehydratase family protein [Caldilineaceae bacterium]
MNLLILGGTVFVGRHLVEAALARGHTVTLFNRGQRNPDLFQGDEYAAVEQLRGDRDGALNALEGKRWDAVIDTCGYVPRIVQISAELLADQVAQYVFISTISVYADFSKAGIDENSPLGQLADPTVEEITGETYGPLKVLCEEAAEAALPGRVLTIRPGLIVGPHDPTDRFTYWPVRIAQGGEILTPGNPEQQVQFIDVRDLAVWTIHMVEIGQNGIYNATGPATPLPMQRFLDTTRTATNADGHFTWVSEAFLQENEVTPFVEMPLWVPPENAGIEQVNCQKAIDAGLTFRPLGETVRATLTWHNERPSDYTLRAGITREREMALLAKWHGNDQ